MSRKNKHKTVNMYIPNTDKKPIPQPKTVEKARCRFLIRISCPVNIKLKRTDLKGFPQWLVILFGVFGLCSFLFCAYTWLWGLPTVVIKENQVSTDESVMVGILSILVTLLVAWQIYTTIVSKEQVNNLEGRINKSSQDAININLYNVFLLQGHNERKLNNPESALNYYVRALDCAIKESTDKRRSHINELIRAIHGMIEPFPNIQINWDEGNGYIEIISQVEHHQKEIVIEYIRNHSFKDSPKSTEFGWFNTNENKKPKHGSYDVITDKQAKSLVLHKYRCPSCGSRRIIYSRIPYQLPYKQEDYMIDEYFSHMTPAKCLYGECGDCGYVILRNIKPLLSPASSCDDA